MKLLSTALLAAGLASLAACGGGAANNASAENNAAEAPLPDEPANEADPGALPPAPEADANASNEADANAAGNAS